MIVSKSEGTASKTTGVRPLVSLAQKYELEVNTTGAKLKTDIAELENKARLSINEKKTDAILDLTHLLIKDKSSEGAKMRDFLLKLKPKDSKAFSDSDYAPSSLLELVAAKLVEMHPIENEDKIAYVSTEMGREVAKQIESWSIRR